MVNFSYLRPLMESDIADSRDKEETNHQYHYMRRELTFLVVDSIGISSNLSIDGDRLETSSHSFYRLLVPQS